MLGGSLPPKWVATPAGMAPQPRCSAGDPDAWPLDAEFERRRSQAQSLRDALLTGGFFLTAASLLTGGSFWHRRTHALC